MRIERVRVRVLSRYLGEFPAGRQFRVITEATDVALERAGFAADAAVGASILPSIRGRLSRFNAEGRYRVRRDLPKEERFISSREFTRVEWHGNDREEVTDTVDYYRMCYPRELISPPSIELTIVENDTGRFISSPELTYDEESDDHNKHTINLMLELFGSCEIVLNNLERLIPPAIERVNWLMLPPGEHPWERIDAHIRGVFGRLTPSVVATVLSRQNVILGHNPNAIYRGVAGFSDYLAYDFADRGLVVLESVRYGNALYIFGNDWEAVSRLTKAEIIQNNLAQERIVHTANWPTRLAEAIG